MNIHEYQAAEILKKHGVQVPEGIVAVTPEEAVNAAKVLSDKTGTKAWVVKAQIHAGGRGKGGGVKVAKTLAEVKKAASEILGMNLVTHQTGSEGKLVHKVLVAQNIYYPGNYTSEEFYMSVLLDRNTGRNRNNFV